MADGFEVNLFAADPRIAKPIQMNFDARGRLWIVSARSIRTSSRGRKRTTKSSSSKTPTATGSDKTTVFADGLLIPTGVEPGDGGVYVANSTELLHFADTNGDGKADKKRIVLSGFGTEDTHHILHTLRWGPAGMLYMNQSIYIHSHIETPYGVKRLNAGGIWQFRPETLQLRVYARGWVNAWGHQLDAYGQSFVTDGAGGQGINFVVPGAAYQTAFGAKRLLPGLNPGSPKYCGMEIVGGRHLPKSWQNNILTNDFRGHRVCRFVITEDGSGFAARQQQDLIKTKHVAFRPIDVKMGPDGAIYIADWYNPIIQHGEVDFRDPRRDHVHGRIWRITYKGKKTLPRPKLVGATTQKLLDALKSPEMWTRQRAKRVLKERGEKKVLPVLSKWIERLDPKDPLFERHQLEALWVHQSLRHVAPKLLAKLLRAKDHRVRAAATRVIGHWGKKEPGRVGPGKYQHTPTEVLRLLSQQIADEHARVRLEAVRVLGALGSQQPGLFNQPVFPGTECAAIALRALDRPVDRFLDYAIWLTARELRSAWLPAVAQGKFDFQGNVAHLTFALKSVGTPGVVRPLIDLLKAGRIKPNQQAEILAVIASLGGPAEMRIVYDAARATNTKPSRQSALLAALADAAARRSIRPAGDVRSILRFIDSKNLSVRAAAIRCAGFWRVAASRRRLQQIASAQTEPLSLRLTAVTALGSLRGPQSVNSLIAFTSVLQPMAIRSRAVVALVSLDINRAADRAVGVLITQKRDDNPAEIVSAFLQRKRGAAALIAALKNRRIPADVAKLALRTVSGFGRKQPRLEAALSTAGNVQSKRKPLTAKQMQVMVAEVRSKGDPRRGEAIFRRSVLNCLKCHSIGGSGGKAGPDLISIGGSAQIDYLIDSLLEPNKKVKENFQTLVVATKKGKVYTGLKVRQTDRDLILRDAEDREIRIPLKSIDERINGKSLMPSGLTEILTRGEILDLVSFLSRLGKVGKFSLGTTRVVRTWRVLDDTAEARFRLRRTSYQSAAGDDTAFVWQSRYSMVAGELPVSSLPELRIRGRSAAGARGMSFVRFRLTVTTPGKLALRFNTTAGLTLWLGTSPLTVSSRTVLDLPRGTHRLTLGIDRNKRNGPLRVELLDVPGSAAIVKLVKGK
ncbi:MAG: HEAT repeat domain-containing protein [Planctomycetes bacterium]|nr:HEAT repeat domain-containing protein [Planctomycetota bacterium]